LFLPPSDESLGYCHLCPYGASARSQVSPSPIEVILFDLGNVILPFDPHRTAEKLSRASQRKEFQDHQRMFTYLFDPEKGAINLYQVGKVSSIEFFRSLKESLSLSLSLSFEAFIPIWNEIFVENEEVSEVIRSLKGTYRLGLLSNTDPLHFGYILAKFPILRAFDKWILSHEVGFRKPEVGIFQSAISWASVDPRKILFIDDIKTHIDVAVSLSMQGIHFISGRQMKEELATRLLRSP
jgi:glucose-1-phosphatase